MVMIGNLCYDEVVNSSEEGMESPISSPHFHKPLSLRLYSNEHQTSSQKLNYFFKSKSYFFSLTPSKKKKTKKTPRNLIGTSCLKSVVYQKRSHTLAQLFAEHSQDHQDWKRPSRSPSATINPAVP